MINWRSMDHALAIGVVLSALLLLSSPVSADPLLLQPNEGTVWRANRASITPFMFRTYLEANRSYACTVYDEMPSNNNYRFIAVKNSAGASLPFISRAEVSPVNSAPSSSLADATVVADSRISVTPQASGFYTFSIGTSFPDGSIGYNSRDPSNATEYRVSCVETSLFGGYNTTINAFNFLELTNSTNASITVTVTVVDHAGTTVVGGAALSIPA